jgi:hypothetical protein
MSWGSCSILFKLKNPILLNDFGRVCGRLDRDLVLILRGG